MKTNIGSRLAGRIAALSLLSLSLSMPARAWVSVQTPDEPQSESPARASAAPRKARSARGPVNAKDAIARIMAGARAGRLTRNQARKRLAAVVARQVEAEQRGLDQQIRALEVQLEQLKRLKADSGGSVERRVTALIGSDRSGTPGR